MPDEKQRRFVTVQEAESLLLDDDKIHTYRVGGPCLIGGDWSRKRLLKAMKKNIDTLHLSGDNARSMKHGLVFVDSHGPLFIETDEQKLGKFEKSGKDHG